MPQSAGLAHQTMNPKRRFALHFDVWLWLVLAFFLVLIIAFVLRLPNQKSLTYFIENRMSLCMLGITLISIFSCKGFWRSAQERVFWGLMAISFIFWFINQLISLFSIDLLNGLLGDLIYFLFYFASLLAIETRHGQPGISTFSKIRYWLNFITNLMFTVGILCYFVIIPYVFDQSSYESWVPSFYCFLTLDIYLVFRFFYVAHALHTARWRAILTLLGIMAIFWTFGDVLELLGIQEWVMLQRGPIDLIWVMPFLSAILATRIVHVGPVHLDSDAVNFQRKSLPVNRLFLVTALMLPIIHLLGNGISLFNHTSYLQRSIFISLWFVLMIVLLVVQYSVLHRRTRLLEGLRLRNVRILEAISRVQSQFIEATDSPSFFENILAQLLRLTDSEYGVVGEIHHTQDNKPFLKVGAIAHVSGIGEGRRFFGQRGDGTNEIHDLDTLFGQAITTGTATISNNPAAFQGRAGFPPGSPEPRAFLSIPLYHREKMIGMFGVSNREKGYGDDLIKYLEPFSTTCGGIISAYQNESERKRMSEIASRFGRILDDSLQEIYIFDTETLLILHVNRGAHENIGYSPDELREMTPEDLYPEEGGRFRDILKPLSEGTSSKEQYTSIHRRKDGSTYPVDVFLQQSSLGTSPVFVAIVLDITERKRMEKEKNRLVDQVIQSQKLETIGTLAGGIAHDFNNILAPIIWYTEMIVNDEDNTDEVREDLKHVLKAANRARDLVQQILTFGRMGEVERNPIQIQLVIEEAIRLLRASLPATIEIIRKVDSKCEPVLADPTQIHQVLMNLCTNAYHAMRKSGGLLEVGLTMVKVAKAEAELHPNLKEGFWVKLTVSDTGHGMDPTTLDRIFEPFFTTKRVGEGTGLGLSVIHGIVMTHGGEISVDSQPGSGTTFSVFLPPIDYDAVVDIKAEHELAKGNERILFVDDEVEIARTGKIMLERFGYIVSAHTSSVDALNTFRENPNDFDIVITDQTMPQITGLRLAGQVKSVRPDIPIVLSTGFSEEVSDDKWKQCGVDRLVMKPVVGKDLHRTIRSVLAATKKKNVR